MRVQLEDAFEQFRAHKQSGNADEQPRSLVTEPRNLRAPHNLSEPRNLARLGGPSLEPFAAGSSLEPLAGPSPAALAHLAFEANHVGREEGGQVDAWPSTTGVPRS